MVLMKAQKQDYPAIKKLYINAFPADERAPFFLIKHRVLQKRATLLVAKEDTKFIGFVYIICYQELVYLFYFAVDVQKRGSGNGTKILELLKKKYAGKKLFLAREQLDKTADNYSQRVKRHEFYLRNGFCDLPCKIQEASVVYDVMSIGGYISAEEYHMLISNWTGKIIQCFIKMKIIE